MTIVLLSPPCTVYVHIAVQCRVQQQRSWLQVECISLHVYMYIRKYNNNNEFHYETILYNTIYGFCVWKGMHALLLKVLLSLLTAGKVETFFRLLNPHTLFTKPYLVYFNTLNLSIVIHRMITHNEFTPKTFLFYQIIYTK